MRVVLLLDEHGAWKACEVNADCPGGHNEALGLPRLARVAGFAKGHDPTRVVRFTNAPKEASAASMRAPRP